MPWIPMYLAADDIARLTTMLNADGEIAFLAADGPKRWKAVAGLSCPADGRIGVWHIPSGPLPLLLPNKNEHDQIHDPFAGWEELRTGADPTTPYFGPGHPGVVWLDVRLSAKEQGSTGGLSSFGWIGRHYSSI